MCGGGGGGGGGGELTGEGVILYITCVYMYVCVWGGGGVILYATCMYMCVCVCGGDKCHKPGSEWLGQHRTESAIQQPPETQQKRLHARGCSQPS